MRSFPVKDPIFRSGVEPELHSVCNRDLDRCRPCVLEHHGGFLLRGDVGEWREPCGIEVARSLGSDQVGRIAIGEERWPAEKAEEIINMLRFDFRCQYDEKDSIGKRYRRQDAIGTPYCITVDHDTLKDNCVTIRFRDTMEQERVSIDKLHDIITEKVSMKNLLKKVIE